MSEKKNEKILLFESGLNGVVVSVADCNPKGAGFDSQVTNVLLISK
jgi:hypothetical protein